MYEDRDPALIKMKIIQAENVYMRGQLIKRLQKHYGISDPILIENYYLKLAVARTLPFSRRIINTLFSWSLSIKRIWHILMVRDLKTIGSSIIRKLKLQLRQN